MEPVPRQRLVAKHPLKRYIKCQLKLETGEIRVFYRCEDALDLLKKGRLITCDQYDAARLFQLGARYQLHSPTLVFGYGDRTGRSHNEMPDEQIDAMDRHRRACLAVPITHRQCVIDFLVYGKPLTSLPILVEGLNTLSDHYRHG